MAPKKQSAAKKKALSDKDLAKREQVDLLVKDLEVQTEKLIKDKEREIEGVITSINTMYKLALMNIPDNIKNASWDSFMSSQGKDTSALDVSREVEKQVQKITSSIKSSRKPKKAATSTAMRASARKKNMPAVVDLQTPTTSRNPRTGSVMGTPMITPKFDTSLMTRTVTRMAKEGEVAVSLNGSPILPYLNSRSKAAKTAKANLAQVPLAGGVTLNLPMEGFQLEGDTVDDEQLRQLEELSKNLQQGVASLKAGREKEDY